MGAGATLNPIPTAWALQQALGAGDSIPTFESPSTSLGVSERSGICPKSQEQLSPFLSVFPKANLLGNPHLFRGSLAACAQQDKTPAGNP